MKNSQFVKLSGISLIALEVEIGLACDTTAQNYCNLPLHYQKTRFLINRCADAIMCHSSLTVGMHVVWFFNNSELKLCP